MEGNDTKGCTKAPPGWACTRDAGHDGPCAAKEQTRIRMRPPFVFRAVGAAVDVVIHAAECTAPHHGRLSIEAATEAHAALGEVIHNARAWRAQHGDAIEVGS